MTSPYFITGPALISFSGGRTSAYMLRQILNAHGGTLSPDVIVTFANTGRERPETLDFVQECGARRNVPIVWLEWRMGEHGSRFEIVSHNSASRDGEPFSALIANKPVLPNPMLRYCTIELKIRVMRDYARSLGWEHWTNVVGLRADEPSRVAKALDRENHRDRWVNDCPLAAAGATEGDVLAFWAGQPFDLRLKSYEGNCDLCFLKSRGKIDRLLRDRPDLAVWWIAEQDKKAADVGAGTAASFRQDRPGYDDMLNDMKLSPTFFDSFENLMGDHQSCEIGCTDQEPMADIAELRRPRTNKKGMAA